MIMKLALFCFTIVISYLSAMDENENQNEIFATDCQITLKPLCEPVLRAFNDTAREIYNFYILDNEISCNNTLGEFKNTYTDLTQLKDQDFANYIGKIPDAQKILFDFKSAVSDIRSQLSKIKSPSDIDNLFLLSVNYRDSLALCFAHCLLDFSNKDYGIFWRGYSNISNMLKGTNMVKEVTIDRDGIIYTLNDISTKEIEIECMNHPHFGRLQKTTKEFIDNLLKISPIISKLQKTGRILLSKNKY